MKIRTWVIYSIFLLLISGTSVFAQNDFKMRQKMTAAGRTMESAVMIKGARERTESSQSGMKNVTIMQCDLKRYIKINDIEKKYMIEPMVMDSAPSAPAAPPSTVKTKTKKGGIVTRTLEIIDTGERKQFFGFTARHIKTIMTTEPSPDACEKDKQRIETDGWYIDLSVGLVCKTEERPQIPTEYRENAPSCQDQSKFIQKGSGKLGYAIQVTSKISMPGMGGEDEDEETKAMMAKMGMGSGMMSTTTEITELSKATLPADLFDVPAGYTEVKDEKDLYGKGTQKAMGEYQKTPQGQAERREMMQNMPAMAGGGVSTAKKPGMVRIGVMAVGNSSGKEISTGNYQMMLVSQMNNDKVEAVAVNSPEQAKQMNCDYVLSTDIKALKQSAASKVGGLFGKVTGQGTGQGKVEATVGYDLKPLGTDGTTLQMQATTAKIEGEENSIMSALSNVSQAVIKAVKK